MRIPVDGQRQLDRDVTRERAEESFPLEPVPVENIENPTSLPLNKRIPVDDQEQLNRGVKREQAAESSPSESMAVENNEKIKENLQDIGRFLLQLPLDVIKATLHAIKQPIRVCIILLLGTYIMKQMASYTLSSIAFGITQGLAPLCTLPLMYTMAICSTGPNLTAPVYAPRYPELVEQQIKFVSVMDSAALNIDLARDMKSAELAVDDLRSKIKRSKLLSKERFLEILNNFGADADEAHIALIELGQGVEGAIDSILGVNEHAIEQLDAIKNYERSGFAGIIYLLAPYSPARKKITEMFDMTANMMGARLEELIQKAVGVLDILFHLETQLGLIKEQIDRDQGETEEKVDSLRGEFWTLFGANREKIKILDKDLKLLAQIENQRSNAVSQVSETLTQLRGLQYNLKFVRSVVKSPPSHSPRLDIEATINTLQRAVARLGDGRDRVKRTGQRQRRITSG